MPTGSLTVSEISARTGISKSTVRAAIISGELTATRHGPQGMYLMLEADVIDWLASQLPDWLLLIPSQWANKVAQIVNDTYQREAYRRETAS